MGEETVISRNVTRRTKVLTVSEILNKDKFSDFSLARIELNGVNDKGLNQDCGALYMVVDGEGQFTIFGEKENRVIEVKKGDSVFIPKGTWYQDQGKMTMYSICSPAFNPEKVKIAKE